MSSWLSQLSKKKKANAKTKRLWEREFSIVEEGLDEREVITFVNDLIAHRVSAPAQKVPLSHQEVRQSDQESPPEAVRSLIERAVTDAEQIATSIKTSAQKEAEQLAAGIKARAQEEADDEAARIIDRAKQGTEELRRQAEEVTQKETGDLLAVLNAKARLIEDEAKQRVETLLLQARQEIEKEVREEYKEAQSRLLRSLMRGAEEMLPLAEISAPLQSGQKPEPVSKEPDAKLTAKEDAKKKAEEIRNAEAARKQAEKEAKSAVKEEAEKKAEEVRNAEAVRKQAEKEAKLAAKEEAEKKAEEVRNAGAARKQAGKEAKLAAKEEAGKKTEEAEEARKAKRPAGVSKGMPGWLVKMGLGKKVEKATTAEVSGRQIEEVQQLGETRPQVTQKAESPSAASAVEKKEASPVQPEETTVPRAVEPPVKRLEQPSPEDKAGTQEPVGIPQKLDREAVYEGEIELTIAVPVDPAAVSKLYNYLQSTPDMKILYTRGSWDRGTTITVTLDKPLPFIGMISKITGLTIAPGLPQKENLVKGSSGSLLGAKKKEVSKIDLILKAE